MTLDQEHTKPLETGFGAEETPQDGSLSGLQQWPDQGHIKVNNLSARYGPDNQISFTTYHSRFKGAKG